MAKLTPCKGADVYHPHGRPREWPGGGLRLLAWQTNKADPAKE